MFQLNKNLKIVRAKTAQAAGVTAINSDVVDTAGYEAVMFAVHFGAIVAGAATSIKLQHGALADGSDMADVAGTSQTVSDTSDDKIFLAEIVQPTKRYVRCVVSRATQNATVDSITAMLAAPRKAPITHDTTIGGSESHLSPASGTA